MTQSREFSSFHFCKYRIPHDQVINSHPMSSEYNGGTLLNLNSNNVRTTSLVHTSYSPPPPPPQVDIISISLILGIKSLPHYWYFPNASIQ